jgi:hypothetical protein
MSCRQAATAITIFYLSEYHVPDGKEDHKKGGLDNGDENWRKKRFIIR